MADVRLDSITKVFPGGVRAVDEVSLDIEHGEFVVLVGPSGCGKSTTLRMIAGLEEITGGTMTIGDRVVNEVPARDRDIAMVFQNYALYPHMSVRKNLAFGADRRRVHRSRVRALLSSGYRSTWQSELREMNERVLEAASTLDLNELLNRLPRELSGGQRQRVAVGRALVRDPAVFLFDEPLSNLDAKLRKEMRAELRDLHRRLGATMVYVTHDQEEAMTLGDRLVVMKDGRVHQCGPPLEVFNRPANRFVASFIGTPPMSFIEGRTDGGVFQCATGERIPLAAPSPADGDAVLGVRPTALRVAENGPLHGRVVGLERFGDATDMRVEAAGTQLVVRTGAEAPEAGSEVSLHVDVTRTAVFDAHGDQRRIG